MNDHLLFKQLYDQTSGTYTYLLADKVSGQAVLIDSVFEQHNRDYSLIQELELSLIACLETHCHADHVTGAWLLKHRTNCQIAASADSGIDLLDISMSQGDEISFGSFFLRVIATPGHTDGCVSYMLNDQSMVFTGDTLLIRGCGRTDFQQGSANKLYHSIKELLFALPDACNVFPAHETFTTNLFESCLPYSWNDPRDSDAIMRANNCTTEEELLKEEVVLEKHEYDSLSE